MCIAEGCSTESKARGLCMKHYMRLRKFGDHNTVLQVHVKRGSDFRHPLYATYNLMLQRCNNPKTPVFKYYGGRGIRVCTRWNGENGFDNFVEDVGVKPRGKFSLDRVNNDGDYEPGNVRWATWVQQAANKRKAVVN